MKRIEWVDIIKGIGSIMVVTSHAYKGVEHLYLLKTIYLFCMPLYFFISGYMYKKRENKKEHIINKSYQLFIPYFSLLIFFLPISIFVFPSYTNLFYYDSIPIDIGRYFFGRSSVNFITGSLWFLPCLFFTQVIYNIIRNKLTNNQVHVLIFIMLILSYVNYIYYHWFWLPLFLNLILASIPIYHIGHLYREYNVKDNPYIMAVFTAIVIWGIIYVTENVYNIVDCFYGVPFFTLFCSIVLTLIVKNISIAIDKYKIFPHLLINLGKASIVIMAFHLTFVVIFEQMSLNPFFMTVLSTVISLGIYFVIKRFTITRALFMGRKDDSRIIKQKIMSLIVKKA